MARGEAFVTCPQCGAQSRVPILAMQHNNYHCSRCGNRIPLAATVMPGDDRSHPPSARNRPKRPLQRRKRR
ncbi:MAG: hypothetical protein H6Q04_1508 [Acidobacteria bacterium]|nr:hypothetical protein [Acidobacteriota bacterium]